MDALVPEIMRWAAIALLVLALIPAALSAFAFIKSRRAAYYVQRRSALKRGIRTSLVTLGVVIVAVGLLIALPFLRAAPGGPVEPLASATPSATAQPSPTTAPTHTATPSPTPEPTLTPTHRPTATAPPIPTTTPLVAPPPDALTPLPSAVPADPEARVELLALSSATDPEGQPIDPRREFATGQHPVLLFFYHEGIADGVPVTFAWYQDEQFMEDCSETWLWGTIRDREWGTEGTASLGCTPAQGWKAGSYEIRVFIETRLQGVAQFVIE